jgi:divalent metal cation (Fe/Co/Zn/Cd) transporter
MLDGVDPNIIDEIRRGATHVAGVKEVTDIRAR